MTQLTYTSQLTIRVTADQRAELDALMARWQLSQAATISRAIREALKRELSKEESKPLTEMVEPSARPPKS